MIAGALSAVVVLFGAASAALFLWPETDDVRRADAVVVLGPGRTGERLSKALELVRRNVAPFVLVSESRRPHQWPLERELCRRADAICFRADPFTTRGEAREVARIADAHGWRSLLIVTSTYHVTRARLLNGRCFHGRIDVVGAGSRRGLRELAETTLHEWGGLIDAVVFARGC